MKLLSWINHEVKLQMKNGLYGVYVIVTLIYIFILGYVPEEYVDIAISFIIFSDPTVLGMIFVGAFILFEKNEGVIKGLGVMPLGAIGYILGKTISILIISLLSSLFIVISYKGLNFNILSLCITVSISSILFTMIGIISSAYANSMNQYFGIVILIGILIMIPLINLLGFNLEFINMIFINSIFILIYQSITNTDLQSIYLITLIGWLFLWMFITEYVVKNKLFKG